MIADADARRTGCRGTSRPGARTGQRSRCPRRSRSVGRSVPAAPTSPWWPTIWPVPSSWCSRPAASASRWPAAVRPRSTSTTGCAASGAWIAARPAPPVRCVVRPVAQPGVALGGLVRSAARSRPTRSRSSGARRWSPTRAARVPPHSEWLPELTIAAEYAHRSHDHDLGKIGGALHRAVRAPARGVRRRACRSARCGGPTRWRSPRAGDDRGAREAMATARLVNAGAGLALWERLSTLEM